MRAIVSDIHGNLEALQAVLEDIRRHGVTEIFCLGDVVGYGPNPRECVDIVMGFNMVLLGNHDQGALYDPEGFNPTAEKAIFWTREQLENSFEKPEDRQRRWDFLNERPRSHREGNLLFVHGSARNPLNEYVFPDDIFNSRKMDQIFARVEQYCFQGHTHVPGVFVEGGKGGPYEFKVPEEHQYEIQLGDQRCLVNVGSVGQPRDQDWRSCYVLQDGDTLYYRRVEYDIESTIGKIYAVPQLDNFLGDRLRDGR